MIGYILSRLGRFICLSDRREVEKSIASSSGHGAPWLGWGHSAQRWFRRGLRFTARFLY